jgi:hypothetical protein
MRTLIGILASLAIPPHPRLSRRGDWRWCLIAAMATAALAAV